MVDGGQRCVVGGEQVGDAHRLQVDEVRKAGGHRLHLPWAAAAIGHHAVLGHHADKCGVQVLGTADTQDLEGGREGGGGEGYTV